MAAYLVYLNGEAFPTRVEAESAAAACEQVKASTKSLRDIRNYRAIAEDEAHGLSAPVPDPKRRAKATPPASS